MRQADRIPAHTALAGQPPAQTPSCSAHALAASCALPLTGSRDQRRDRLHPARDGTGVETPDIEIRTTACKGQPVARISEAPDKTRCRDENVILYLKHLFRVTDAQQGLST
jgi:nicotinate phosphoribosyltransferase